MKKIYSAGAILLSASALCSCGGDSKPAEVAPEETPAAWSVEMTYLSNEVAKSKEVTNYGENNEVVSVDLFSVDKTTGKSTQTDHIIYQNGKPVYSNVFGDNGTVVGHSKYAYNEAGNIVSEVISSFVTELNRIETTKRYLYEYDANGNVTLVKEQNFVINAWVNDYEWSYTYDDQQRLTARVDFNYNGKDRKQSCQYGYIYKEGSNQIDVEDYYFYDLKTNRLRHDAKTHYEYDKNGRVKSKTIERHKANAKRDLVNSRLISYLYNEAGQITDIVEKRWNSSEKKWNNEAAKAQSFDYSESGQLLSRIESYNTNKGFRVNKDIYTPAPEGRTLVSPAAPVESVKPVINLDDKHKTDKNEED